MCIEEEVHKDPESSTFSVFLIFRLAFSIYLPPKTHKSTIGISLLSALNLNSFVTPNSSPSSSRGDEDLTSVTTDATDTTLRKDTPHGRSKISRELPTISISDTDEETEELHFLRKERRGRRGSSPLHMRKRMSSPLLTYTYAVSSSSPPTNRPKSPTMDFAQEYSKSVSPLAASSLSELSSRPGGADVATPASSEAEPVSRGSSLPLLEMEGSGGRGDGENSHPRQGSEVLFKQDEDDQEEPQGQLSQRESEISLFQEAEIILPPSVEATPPPDPSPPVLRGKKRINRQAESYPTLFTRSYRLSPLEASVPSSPHNPPSSPDHQHSRDATPTKQALLLSELINSPRFYHPQEGQDLTGCTFLYRELMKGLGHSRNFMLSRHFWNQTFISTLTVERESLGWNEWTVSLYEK